MIEGKDPFGQISDSFRVLIEYDNRLVLRVNEYVVDPRDVVESDRDDLVSVIIASDRYVDGMYTSNGVGEEYTYLSTCLDAACSVMHERRWLGKMDALAEARCARVLGRAFDLFERVMCDSYNTTDDAYYDAVQSFLLIRLWLCSSKLQALWAKTFRRVYSEYELRNGKGDENTFGTCSSLYMLVLLETYLYADCNIICNDASFESLINDMAHLYGFKFDCTYCGISTIGTCSYIRGWPDQPLSPQLIERKKQVIMTLLLHGAYELYDKKLTNAAYHRYLTSGMLVIEDECAVVISKFVAAQTAHDLAFAHVIKELEHRSTTP